MERVSLTIDEDDPSPEELRGYFARVFEELDARPRPLLVSVRTRNDRDSLVSLDLGADGNPVFRIEGRSDAAADFRGRYLAEHEIPLAFSRRGLTCLVMTPTTGNRVKVRRARFWERWFS